MADRDVLRKGAGEPSRGHVVVEHNLFPSNVPIPLSNLRTVWLNQGVDSYLADVRTRLSMESSE